MTDKEFNKFDKHYNNLVKKGTIKTMNDACIYKLAIEEAIKVMHSCKSDSELLVCPECKSTDCKTAIYTDYKECNKCYHYWEAS